MKREEMREKINEELKHIPRSSKGSDQNLLRSCYNFVRAHDFSLNPTLPANNSLVKAIEEIRKSNPDFSPSYDRDFFHI